MHRYLARRPGRGPRRRAGRRGVRGGLRQARPLRPLLRERPALAVRDRHPSRAPPLAPRGARAARLRAHRCRPGRAVPRRARRRPRRLGRRRARRSPRRWPRSRATSATCCSSTPGRSSAYPEIAAALSISPGTVKSRLHRARAARASIARRRRRARPDEAPETMNELDLIRSFRADVPAADRRAPPPAPSGPGGGVSRAPGAGTARPALGSARGGRRQSWSPRPPALALILPSDEARRPARRPGRRAPPRRSGSRPPPRQAAWRGRCARASTGTCRRRDAVAFAGAAGGSRDPAGDEGGLGRDRRLPALAHAATRVSRAPVAASDHASRSSRKRPAVPRRREGGQLRAAPWASRATPRRSTSACGGRRGLPVRQLASTRRPS